MGKIEYLIKHNNLIQRIYVFLLSKIFKGIGFFIRPQKKQVLFQSLIGKSFGDSPKILFEEMKKDPLFSGFEYIWAFDNPKNFSVNGAKKVKLNSLKYFITALKSGIWITNVNIERGLQFKPSTTIFLNTWHGSAPMKLDGNAQKNRNDYNFYNVDILCSNSKWQDEEFFKYFNANPQNIIRCGMPRNDILFNVNKNKIADLRQKYQIPDDKKVILYAPTWRDFYDEKSIPPIPINMEYWKEQLSDEYVLLFRAHHLTKKVNGLVFNNFVRDYSGPYNINELLIISDILISDYSSAVTDYSILERPVLLYAYDYEEYRNKRGFFISLEEFLPGYVFTDEYSLIHKIKTLNVQDATEKIKEVKKKYIYCYGNSTEICINELKKKII